MWQPFTFGSNVPGCHWEVMPGRMLHLTEVNGKRLATVYTFGSLNHLLDLNLRTYSTTHDAMYAAEKLVRGK